MPNVKISVASRKAKGRRLQNIVADLISDTFNLPKLDVMSTPMGSNGVDIFISLYARQKFAYAVECKNQEIKSPSAKWWEQCVKNAKKEDLMPLLVVKKNGKGIYAIFESDEKLDPLKKSNFWVYADGKKSFNFIIKTGVVLRATPIRDFLNSLKNH